ncbi:MAG: 3-deoxy-8-phosphooctulonate synthase [Candidatus Hydrogenedentota bacterium]
MYSKTVKLRDIKIGNTQPFVLIAGPCAMESEKLVFTLAETLKSITDELDISFIFKVSYDKANRLSLKSFRGLGFDKGLNIIKKLRDKLDIPVLTDVHCREEIKKVGDIVDIIQIPAFLCRQTDIVLEAAGTGKIINIKKGQFLAPEAMKFIVEKIESTGNKNIILTERGTSFGYGDLVVDFRGIEIMKRTGYPVIFDATHSVQMPSRGERCSGGQREFIRPLCRAAVSIGVAGIYLETHPEPEKALCDGPNMLPVGEMRKLLKELKSIDSLL